MISVSFPCAVKPQKLPNEKYAKKCLPTSQFHDAFMYFLLFQKSDGTCRTDFKKTRSQEDVIQVFKEFVEEDVNIIARGIFIFLYTYVAMCLMKDTEKTECTVHIHKATPQALLKTLHKQTEQWAKPSHPCSLFEQM